MITIKSHRDSYSSCLAAPGSVGTCAGTPAESWVFTPDRTLKSSGHCLTAAGSKPVMQACTASNAQHWNYTLAGNLVKVGDGKCISTSGPATKLQSLTMQNCSHNQPNQIWSLLN
jgi:alpha-galactosidase